MKSLPQSCPLSRPKGVVSRDRAHGLDGAVINVMANSYAEQTFKSEVRTLFFGDYTCAPEGALEEGQLYYLYVSFIYIYIIIIIIGPLRLLA